jgi:hypothetical protein
MFLMMSAIFTIASPLTGMVLTNYFDSKAIILAGFFCCFMAAMLIGPSPLLAGLPIQSLPLNIGAIIFSGNTLERAIFDLISEIDPPPFLAFFKIFLFY